MLVLLACPRGGRLRGPVAEGDQIVLDAARERPIPDPVRARLNIKLDSKNLDLAASVGAGLVVDRPGRGRLDLLSPLGGALATVSSDGAGLSVLLTGKREQIVATDAELVLREATGGVAGVDDVLALLVGDLPFDDAPISAIVREGDPEHPETIRVKITLEGPEKSRVEAWLDASDATPRRLVATGRDGVEVLRADFDAFEARDGALWPTRLVLAVPSLTLDAEVRYKSFEVLAEAPAVFDVRAPDGWTIVPMEQATKSLGATIDPKKKQEPK
jgi:hypothetical protein